MSQPALKAAGKLTQPWTRRYFKGPQELVHKWKTPVRFTSIPFDLKLRTVAIDKQTGDFELPRLSRLVNTETVTSVAVEAWKKHISSTRTSTLVFGVDQFHARALTEAFQKEGIEARYTSLTDPKVVRMKLNDSFAAGMIQVLVGSTEMIQQHPLTHIDSVLIVAPTTMNVQYAHMVKHGAFLPGSPSRKTDCHVLEIIDTFPGSGAVTAATFFGVKYSQTIEDKTIPEMKALAMRAMSRPPSTESGDGGIELPYPYNYLSKSPFAWARCLGNVYIQSLHDGSHIRIEAVNADEANFERLLLKATHFPPEGTDVENTKLVVEGKDLEETIAACDSYVSKMTLQIRNDLRWNATWRREQASTEDQNTILAFPPECLEDLKNSLLQGNTSKYTKEEMVRAMNAGEAVDVIARVKWNQQTCNLLSSRDQRSIIQRMKEGANPYSFKKKR